LKNGWLGWPTARAGIIPGVVGIQLYMTAIKWTVWRDPKATPLSDSSS
jgi:C4-dicarboxylate transporter, DctM subunit